MEASGLRGLGGAGFPAGRKWRIVRGGARAAPDGREHRRGRARHLQGPRLPGARPAPLPRRHADRRLGGGHRRASTSTCATNTTAAARCWSRNWRACRPSRRRPACRSIELRRGAGAYICGEESAMIESIEGKRGMPRLRPPVRGAGRPVRAADAGTQLRDAVLGARAAGATAPSGSPRRARNGRKGLRSFSVSGRVQEPGREARAGRHHDPGTDRRVLRRHAGRATASTPTCRAALRAASCRRAMNEIPLDFDTLQPYGCFIGSAAVIVLSDQDTAAGAARNLMRFFRDESCGQCTPCRAGTAKALALMEQPQVGPAAAGGAVAGDARCVDLRPGPGGAEPGRLRREVFPARTGLKVMYERRHPRMNWPSSTRRWSASR